MISVGTQDARAVASGFAPGCLPAHDGGEVVNPARTSLEVRVTAQGEEYCGGGRRCEGGAVLLLGEGVGVGLTT